MEQTQSSTHPGSPIELLQHSQLGGMAAMTAAAEAHAASLLALFPTASYSATTPQDPLPAVPSPSSARTSSAETEKRLKKHRICQVSTCLLLLCWRRPTRSVLRVASASVRPDREGVRGGYCCTRERKRRCGLVHSPRALVNCQCGFCSRCGCFWRRNNHCK